MPLTTPLTTPITPARDLEYRLSRLDRISTPESFTGPAIFVSGCNRGGTSIVSQLLAAHPEVRSVGRGPFNEGQYIWRRRWRDWSRHRWALPPWRWYLQRDERAATPAAVAFFRNAFAEAMPSPGRMLEKTPANALRLRFINALYPDCYFVHVLRDGRHTTASLIARRVWPTVAPHQWVQAHRIALKDLALLPQERACVVRYEELVADPTRTLEQICRRCRLSWDDSSGEAVLSTARQRLVTVEDRWSRLPSLTRNYALHVIADLQRSLDYPLDL